MHTRHPRALATLLAVAFMLLAVACGSAQASSRTGQPSVSAKMVCDTEVKTQLAGLLSLQQQPSPKSSWADNLYTCTYDLPPGTLVMSVKQLPTDAAAYRYYTTSQKKLGAGRALTGSESLGRAAFQSNAGVVLVVKDNLMLRVDARKLPAKIGVNEMRRGIFAYSMAANVMGCWTGA